MKTYGELRPHPMERRKEKPKPKEPDPETMKKEAEFIMEQKDKEVFETFVRLFKKKYGKTPKEVLNQ